MAKTTANISIDNETKLKAQELFSELGMDLSTAVTIFFRQAIRERSIPFNITADVPNIDTIAAIKEIEDMKSHPERYKKYRSFSDALVDLDKDEVTELA